MVIQKATPVLTVQNTWSCHSMYQLSCKKNCFQTLSISKSNPVFSKELFRCRNLKYTSIREPPRKPYGGYFSWKKILNELLSNDWKELTPDELESVAGGTGNETSDKLFRALVVSFKNNGLTKEELANFIKTSDTVFNVKGMDGVTVDDAMEYLDTYWDKF